MLVEASKLEIGMVVCGPIRYFIQANGLTETVACDYRYNRNDYAPTTCFTAVSSAKKKEYQWFVVMTAELGLVYLFEKDRFRILQCKSEQ